MKLFQLCLVFLLFAAPTPVNAEDELQAHTRYHLRSGDSLTLEYRFTPEFNQTVVIQPDGFVSLNVVGDLKVSGMTTTQAHDLIVQRAALRLNGPELNVILKEFEAPYIGVSGEVDKPGRLTFYEHTTALQAIMLSGGFKESAQRSQVIVFRKIDSGSSKTIQLDLRKMDQTRDLERDCVLQAGDIVFVPRNKLQNLARIIKAANLGFYLDPLTYATR